MSLEITEQYVLDVLKTEARDLTPVLQRLQNDNMPFVVHTHLVSVANTGRTIDALKRAIFYGKGPKKTELVSQKIRVDELSVVQENLTDEDKVRLLHATIGMATEAGEVAEILLAALDGSPIDRDHLIEELGDKMWYIGLACAVIKVPLAEVMRRNTAKLMARYEGGTFTEAAALNRDLEKEKTAFGKTS